MIPVPWEKIRFFGSAASGTSTAWVALEEAETDAVCTCGTFWNRYDKYSERDTMKKLMNLVSDLYLDWSRRFSRRRERGRDTFWDEECERIRKGSTRNWSSEQRKDILNKKRPQYKGKTLEAHHAYPASMYPHLADKHEVIYPVTHSEHLRGWHGGSYRKAIPGKPIKKKSDFLGGLL